MMRFALAAFVVALAACTPPASNTAEKAEAASGVAPEIQTLVQAAMPGVTITAGAPDGVDEYEVTGTLNGQEYEFDLMGPEGGWRVVEIQRDVSWNDVPQSVHTAVGAAPNAFTPVRVIESRQTGDGTIIYELFAEGAPAGSPTMEVRVQDGEAAVMPPPH